MKIIFFVIVFSIFLSMNIFVLFRGWHVLAFAPGYRLVYTSFVVILFLAMIVSMVFGYAMPLPIAKIVSFLGFTYIIILIYLLITFLAVDIIRMINYFLHFLPVGMESFRKWSMFVALIVTGISLMIGNFNFNNPKIVTLNLKSEKYPQNKEIKIVAVSDIHLGISIDKKNLRRYVDLINEQKPDIVLMAGDISDRFIAPVIQQNMDEEFRAIIAPMGVFAINGNHEHYAETPDATAKFLQKAGIVVLRDEVFLVDSSFYVVGREDRTSIKRKPLANIINGLDRSKPLILMDHQPFQLEEAEQNNIDFQISGHTHNGQFFPGNLFVKGIYELGYGYLKKGKTHYYVSSGLGLWGPQYRIGTQSELVVVNLRY